MLRQLMNTLKNLTQPGRWLLRTGFQALVWCVLWSVVSACNPPRLESRLDSVEPTTLYTRPQQPMTFRGTFYTQLRISAVDDTYEVYDQFTALLYRQTTSSLTTAEDIGEPIEIKDIQYDSLSQLSAVSPAEIPSGYYRLELRDPANAIVPISSDFLIQVPAMLADHISLTAPSLYLPLDKELALNAQVVNVDGTAAASSTYMDFSIFSLTAQVTVASGSGLTIEDMLDQDKKRIGTKVYGMTDAAGKASIKLSNTQVENFTVRSYSRDLPHFQPDEWFTVYGLSSVFSQMAVTVTRPTASSEGAEKGGGLKASLQAQPSDEVLEVIAGEKLEVTVQALSDQGALVPEVEGPFELLDAETGLAPELVSPSGTDLELVGGAWKGQVTFTQSTLTRLLAIGPEGKYGFSSDIEVHPANPTEVSVRGPGDIQAGDTFEVVVQWFDRYDNEVPFDASTQIVVWDISNTLSCSEPEVLETVVTYRNCSTTKARSGNRIRVRINGTLSAESAPFDVYPGPAAGIQIGAPETPAQAGIPFTIPVSLVDSWNNVVPSLTGDTFIVMGTLWVDGAPVGFSEILIRADGEGDFLAQYNGVTTAAQLQVTDSLRGFESEGEFFAITPGPVADFEVDVCLEADQSCAWTAGEGSEVSITAFDAHQNRVYDFAGTVTLSANLETLDPEKASTSDFVDGQASLEVTLYKATQSAVLTALSESASGESQTFQVQAGAFDKLGFLEIQPLYWRDEAFLLTVQALDAFNNPTSDFAGGAVRVQDEQSSIMMEGDAGPRQAGIATPLQAGSWSGQVVLTRGVSRNVLTIVSGSTSYDSAPFSVFLRNCTPEVLATLKANGKTGGAVACLVTRPGGVTSARVDFQAVVTGQPQDYLWMFGDGTSMYGKLLSEQTHDYIDIARYDATVYVTDSKLCAAAANARVYVNADDNSPAGPLLLTPSNTVLLASSGTDTAQADVAIQAFDCQGDVASLPSFLTVQANLGRTVQGDASSETPGIQVQLERFGGTGQLKYSVSETAYGGNSRVIVDYLGGVAEGMVEFEVLNDLVPPIVLEHTPQGFTTTPVSEITVTFSEPLRGGSAVQAVDIQVDSELHGLQTIANRTLEANDTRLRLTLATPLALNGPADRITVTLPSSRSSASLTDVDGNRLDGNWSGVSEDASDPFVFTFGNVAVTSSPVTLDACELSTDTFSPDGQDGPGAEADVAIISGVLNSGLPLKGIATLIIDEATDEVVDWQFQRQTSTNVLIPFEMQWDGTDLNGVILQNGVYSVQILTVDMVDNRSQFSCQSAADLLLLNPLDLGDYP